MITWWWVVLLPGVLLALLGWAAVCVGNWLVLLPGVLLALLGLAAVLSNKEDGDR